MKVMEKRSIYCGDDLHFTFFFLDRINKMLQNYAEFFFKDKFIYLEILLIL